MQPYSKNSSGRPLPSVLPFKSGAAFLEYQCKYGHTDIVPKQGVAALVVDAKKELGTSQAVKVEADGQQMAMLKVASKDGGFTVAARTLSGEGDRLKPDDVVIWVPLEYAEGVVDKDSGMDPRFGWIGFIAAKVAPEIDTANPEFKILSRYD